MNRKLKENAGIILIVVLFLFIFLLKLNPNADLWWDSSVYINMGKYIYSFGETGLYEASRPLVWPLLLGFFWKMGLDALFFGKLMVLLFGVGIIILTYLIADELFTRRIALISSLMLAFSPVFFLFNSIMFTEIPSTFFILFGFYFFIKKKYNPAGMLFGIAFMTRFFQIIIIIPIYLFFIYLTVRKKTTIKQIFISLLFFLLPIIPYLILNFLLYNNPIYPFQLQAWMAKFTGWIYHQPFDFYLINLVKENALILFSILGIVLVLRNEKKYKCIVPFVLLLAFLPYNFASHKEMRFLIPIFPFLYILSGYGIVKFSEFFRNHNSTILSIIILIGIIQIHPQLRLNDYDDKLDTFYNFVKNNKEGVWISNPSFIAYKDIKAEELIYYPLYDIDRIDQLQRNVDDAKYVLINTCDILPCPPYEDSCMEEHENFLNTLKGNFNLYYNKKLDNCEHYIFTS